jgi:hypothetical protein
VIETLSCPPSTLQSTENGPYTESNAVLTFFTVPPGQRMDQCSLESRYQRGQAPDSAVEERGDGSESIVVERGHFTRVDGAVRRACCPTAPTTVHQQELTPMLTLLTIVVARMPTGYSQLGLSLSFRNRYAT